MPENYWVKPDAGDSALFKEFEEAHMAHKLTIHENMCAAEEKLFGFQEQQESHVLQQPQQQHQPQYQQEVDDSELDEDDLEERVEVEEAKEESVFARNLKRGDTVVIQVHCCW